MTTRQYPKELNYIDEEFLDTIEALETLVTKASLAIDESELEYFIPFHYNTIEVTIPSYHVQKFMPGMDVDISVLFSRTKFTEKYNLEYTYENIIEFYKNVSVTIGKHGSNRVYHINMKSSIQNGENPYRAILDNIKRLYKIHTENKTFDITSEALYNLTEDIVTIVNPSTSNFPRSFTM